MHNKICQALSNEAQSNQNIQKVLIIDGIGGVPLGRELGEALRANNVSVAYIDALSEQPRTFYRTFSIILKTRNKAREKDGFTHLARLPLESLMRWIDHEQPSHILVIGFLYKHWPLEALDLIKARGIKCFLYDTDSCNLYSKRREFVYFIQEELPRYTAILSFSQVTTRFFSDTCGLDSRYVPFGATTPLQRSSMKDKEAVFVGSADLRRVFLLERIREHVVVRGNRWRRNLPLMSPMLQQKVTDIPLWGEELQSFLQSAKIVINITRSDFYGAETGVNLRIFEALASGCFLLTDYCEEVAELFIPGVEIETFRSAEELRQKVAYYLAHEVERETIARQGHERFLKEYTWQARAQQIVREMNACVEI